MFVQKKKNLNNDNLPKETQIFVLLTVFTLFFVRQKEERLKKEDLEGRGRENDYGCSPTTTAATRRTERQTAVGRAATPEDEDARLTTTRAGLSVGWRQFWNQRPNLCFCLFYYYHYYYYYYYYYASNQPVRPEHTVQHNDVYWKH